MTIRQIALRLAHGQFSVGVSNRGAAFGLRQHDGVRLCRNNGVEVGIGQASLQAVDAYDQIRPRRSRTGFLQKRRRALPGAGFAVERD